MNTTRRRFLSLSAASALGLALARADDAPKLRVAVIGHTGRGNYGHGLDTMWLKVPGVELVAVADADAKGLAAAQQRLKLNAGFADYRQMLAATRPDLVAIAPRFVDQHRDMAMAAIEAGARGIYIEKPFCRSLVEADEIVAACKDRKVRLAIAHRNRFHPVVPVVQRLVKEGAIGRLLEIRTRGKEDQRGGAVDLWVLGSHVLNFVHYFAGAPKSCMATLLRDGRPVVRADVTEGAEGLGPLAGNAVHARFETESGVPAFFDSLANAGVREANFGVQLIGTTGVIDLRIDVEPLAHFLPGSTFPISKEPRQWTPISSAGIGVPEPIADLGKRVSGHLLAADDLIAAIRDDRPTLCSAEDGRVIVEMISAIFESHRLHGQRVTFPLATRTNPLVQL
jgi:predicted dehydrogenase